MIDVKKLSEKLRDPNAKIESLVQYIADRAEDPIHKDHRQIIADFLDTFVLTELKGKDPVDPIQIQSYTKTPEGPEKAPKKTVRVPYGTTAIKTPNKEESPERTPSAIGAIARPRNGNGHISMKKRSLSNDEKDLMRSFFRSKNGIFEEDDLVAFREQRLDPEVSIFQVTGFMTLIHKDIAAGRFSVPNMAAYLEWMRKQRRLAARYNSPKYQRLRQKNASCLAGIIK